MSCECYCSHRRELNSRPETGEAKRRCMELAEVTTSRCRQVLSGKGATTGMDKSIMLLWRSTEQPGVTTRWAWGCLCSMRWT